jgi:hypothetical protein
MKKLSKLGFTLLALALPLVTSANAVGVDKPTGESKEKRRCQPMIQQEVLVIEFDDITCVVVTTTATFPNCNQVSEMDWACDS